MWRNDKIRVHISLIYYHEKSLKISVFLTQKWFLFQNQQNIVSFSWEFENYHELQK